MPTINDDAAANIGVSTDDGLHIGQVVGGQAAWSLVISAPAGGGAAGTFHVNRTVPSLSIAPSAGEIGTALAPDQTIYVYLPNQVVETYNVNASSVPVFINSSIGARRFAALPSTADYNVGEQVELYGQANPDDDGVYILTDVGGGAPLAWHQA